jgi:hypothetical protein
VCSDVFSTGYNASIGVSELEFVISHVVVVHEVARRDYNCIIQWRSKHVL